ncbi:hypothetical protein [Marinobacter sp. OP 3.4]|uniref:hypothetical protein n=1 Tax=Marinobacter sp. OP 3.4 TaxID=3076501 RepID=UPI002E1F058F
MKWLIVLIIIAGVAYWLYRGQRRNRIEDPDVVTIEKKDYYLTPDDNASEEAPTPDKDNPRH